MSMTDIHQWYKSEMIDQFSCMVCSNVATSKLQIRGKDGKPTHSLTEEQCLKGHSVGTIINANCCVCCKYLSPTGDAFYKQICVSVAQYAKYLFIIKGKRMLELDKRKIILYKSRLEKINSCGVVIII